MSSLWVGGWEVVAGCVDGRVRVYDVRMGRLSVDVMGCRFFLSLYLSRSVEKLGIYMVWKGGCRNCRELID